MSTIPMLRSNVIWEVFRRELRVMTLRFAIIMGTLVLLFISKYQEPRFFYNTGPYFVFCFAFGLILGVDFGIRDRTTGFVSTLLHTPVNQGQIKLIRLAARCVPVTICVAVICLPSLFSVRFDAFFSTFWFLAIFLTSVVASQVVKKMVLAICLIPIMLGLWYLSGFGISFVLMYLYPDSISLLNLFLVAVYPTIVVYIWIFSILTLLIMTLSMTSECFSGNRNSLNPISKRQLSIHWGVAAIVYCIILMSLPFYADSLPASRMSSVVSIKTIPGSTSFLVRGRYNHIDSGYWLMNPSGHHQRLSLPYSYLTLIESKENLLLALRSFELFGKRSRLLIYRGSLTREPDLELNRLCALGTGDNRSIWLPENSALNPSQTTLLLVRMSSSEHRELCSLDLDSVNPEQSLESIDLTEYGHVDPLGWLENQSLVALQHGLDMSAHIWIADLQGQHQRIHSLDKTQRAKVLGNGRPIACYNPVRQSVFIVVGNQQEKGGKNLNPRNLQLIEFSLDGDVMIHRADFDGDRLHEMQVSQDGQSVYLEQWNMCKVFDLHSGETMCIGDISLKDISADDSHWVDSTEIDSNRGFPKQINIQIKSMDSGQTIREINQVQRWLWQDKDHLIILKVNGQLGLINIHSGEFQEYCDFNWRTS